MPIVKYNSNTHVLRLLQLPCQIFERLICILFDCIFPQKCTKYISIKCVPPLTEPNSVANFGDFISKYNVWIPNHVLNSKIVPLEVLSWWHIWRFLHNMIFFLNFGAHWWLIWWKYFKTIDSNLSSRVKDRFKLTQALVVDPLYLQHSYSESAIDYRVSLYFFYSKYVKLIQPLDVCI